MKSVNKTLTLGIVNINSSKGNSKKQWQDVALVSLYYTVPCIHIEPLFTTPHNLPTFALFLQGQ